MSKIAVIGAGQVGATTAYTLAVSGLAEEIAVVDLNEALAWGVAADVAHGMPFCAPVRLCAGDYGAAEGADMAIMTAGAAREARRDPPRADRPQPRHHGVRGGRPASPAPRRTACSWW